MKSLMMKERPRARRRQPMQGRKWIKREENPTLDAAAKKRRSQFDNEEVPMFESRADVARSAGPTVTFNHIPADRWAAIFGSPEEIAARRRQAIERQVLESRSPGVSESATAIITDSQYEGWDPGLRKYTKGKAHRRELMKRANGGEGVRCVYD